MEKHPYIRDFSEAVKDPTAKLKEEFFENYGTIQMLLQFSDSATDSGESDSKLEAFLKSPGGRDELRLWQESFASVFDYLDLAVENISEGEFVDQASWENGVEATQRALNALAHRLEVLVK